MLFHSKKIVLFMQQKLNFTANVANQPRSFFASAELASLGYPQRNLHMDDLACVLNLTWR